MRWLTGSAEIAWVAKQLRKCQEMVPADQLQIDIFVTKAKPAAKPRPLASEKQDDDDLALPRPGFAVAGAGGGRTSSTDSLASMMSQDHLMEQEAEDLVDTHLEENYADIIDLTNYEDEEDNDDPNEMMLSDRMQQQGKIRRARTRKTLRREARHAASARAYGPIPTPAGVPPQVTVQGDDDDEGEIKPEGAYDQYDPFSSHRMRAPSPAPSDVDAIEFHSRPRSHSKPQRKTGPTGARPNSMVLLETGNLDPQGDAALWIDSVDYEAMQELSEMARPGKPKLAQVLEEEIALAKGSIIVGSEFEHTSLHAHDGYVALGR